MGCSVRSIRSPLHTPLNMPSSRIAHCAAPRGSAGSDRTTGTSPIRRVSFFGGSLVVLTLSLILLASCRSLDWCQPNPHAYAEFRAIEVVLLETMFLAATRRVALSPCCSVGSRRVYRNCWCLESGDTLQMTMKPRTATSLGKPRSSPSVGDKARSMILRCSLDPPSPYPGGLLDSG